MTTLDFEKLNQTFETESAVLLHLVTQIDPHIPVLFTNTGFHFKETLEHRDKLVERLKLNLRELKPEISNEEFLTKKGKLYERDPDACCAVNKIAPFEKALKDYKAWITGIRRNQADTRQKRQFVEQDRETLVKVSPLLNWTSKMFWDYAKKHDLPYHPLSKRGIFLLAVRPNAVPVPFNWGKIPGRAVGLVKIK